MPEGEEMPQQGAIEEELGGPEDRGDEGEEVEVGEVGVGDGECREVVEEPIGFRLV